jgi:hypothetical protein
MAKLTPQELSRKKEYSDLMLRRQAEDARNRQLREQQARLQGTAGVRAQRVSLSIRSPYSSPRLLLSIVVLFNSLTELDRPYRRSEAK